MAAVVLFMAVFSAYFLVRFPTKYRREITLACAQYNVSDSLVYSVIWAESKFDSSAVSKAGAIGLMQLMPSTAQYACGLMNISYAKNDLYTPDFNIKVGVFYLGYLLQKFNQHDAVAAYNAGEGAIKKWRQQNKSGYPFKETTAYVKNVYKAKAVYRFRA